MGVRDPVMPVLLFVLLLSGGGVLPDFLHDIPIAGRILEACNWTIPVAKCPPEAVDTAAVRDLIREGVLSEVRCLWFVPISYEQR
jgi:hypothetical protein